MRDSIEHIKDIDPPCTDDFKHSDMMAVGEWICRRCGQSVAWGQTHICYGHGPEDTIMYSYPPTELLAERVAELERQIKELNSTIFEIMNRRG